MKTKHFLFIHMLLFASLATDALAILPAYAREVAPMIMTSLKEGKSLTDLFGNRMDVSNAKLELGLGISAGVNTVDMRYSYMLNDLKNESVAVINIQGPMSKGDSCMYGTSDWVNWIAAADANAFIKAIVVCFDSPGGFVSGTQSLGDAMRNTQKPVLALVKDGCCASSAYWAASQADEVYATHETCSIGSIGVYVQFSDMRKFYEAQGVVIREIYSDYSPEKNDVFIKALDGEEQPLKDEFLNPSAKAFIKAIQTGRSGKLNAEAGDPFKGKLYGANDAKKLGLIDGILSFEKVVERAFNLSNQVQIV